MKNFWLFAVACLCLLCCWCGTETSIEVHEEQFEPEEVAVQESDTPKMLETEIFENNLKCQDYKDAFIERSEHVASPLTPIWITIFYSPVKNTCIWYFSTHYDNWKIWDEYLYTTEYYVVDAFDSSAEWSIYQYSINNTFNKKWCDWVSWFWYDAWILKSECNSEEDVENLWRDEINYLKWN